MVDTKNDSTDSEPKAEAPARNENRYFYPRHKNADGSLGVTVVAKDREEADNKLKQLAKDAKDD